MRETALAWTHESHHQPGYSGEHCGAVASEYQRSNCFLEDKVDQNLVHLYQRTWNMWV